MKLIEGWKQSWRLLTVQYAAAVAILPEVIYRLAEVFESLMPALSSVVLDNLPPWLRATCAVLALLAVFLRLVKQKPLPTS